MSKPTTEDLLNMTSEQLQELGTYPIFTKKEYYDVSTYPWAYDSWLLQNQAHWLPAEIPLADDIKDWETVLTEDDKTFLTQVFKLFTQMDVNVLEDFNKWGSFAVPLEVSKMVASYMNAETIHIDAYALLLNTLPMPEGIYKEFLDIPAMKEKNDFYTGTQALNLREFLINLATVGAFGEGVSLFASFAMLMNYPRFNKMKGMSQIVTWSIRDESIHCEGKTLWFNTILDELGIDVNILAPTIVENCREVVDLEIKVIDDSFNNVEVKGLTRDDMVAYIKFMADWRLSQLNIEPVYGFFNKEGNLKEGMSHPILWLESLLASTEHSNFFETRATEYTKASTTGEWTGVIDKYNAEVESSK